MSEANDHWWCHLSEEEWQELVYPAPAAASAPEPPATATTIEVSQTERQRTSARSQTIGTSTGFEVGLLSANSSPPFTFSKIIESGYRHSQFLMNESERAGRKRDTPDTPTVAAPVVKLPKLSPTGNCDDQSTLLRLSQTIKALHALSYGRCCIICVIASAAAGASPARCLQHGCFLCTANDHSRAACPARCQVDPMAQTCFLCALPCYGPLRVAHCMDLEGKHPARVAKECNSYAKGILLRCCFAIYRSPGHVLLQRGSPVPVDVMSSVANFSRWLWSVARGSRLCNCIPLFLWFVEQSGVLKSG